ncbi:uncharacterized protein LOC107728137 [Sinocyclocheilus rhinocerous]|uniref:uncharacterized protein LOC107728137 n=1 Tax=Sinocyclocheilus rhinocerous TaxID=307959 RepID=UPI0007B80943|nr:PREDICTED: uncharacterized protein LOC107728137 [Sinocyclocheilus rhinocerous]
MRRLLGILVLLKYCICGDVVNFDSDIKDFVVGNGKLFVLTDHRLHQMSHDLSEEKRKIITNATEYRVNILVPFDANNTLITCGTFNDGYCEVLDINDITNSIYYESNILIGPRQDEKYVAFIAGTGSSRYLLVGKKDDDTKAQDARYSVVTLWNTLQSQYGGIFSKIAEGSDASIQSTVRDVEFVGGFQRVSPSESYLFLNAKTGSERKVLVLWMNSSKGKKRDIIKSLQAATIRCCSDKARPVLVACTVIPSVNSVIWAGVFSAQNQQDPENSALALYDIRSIQGRVKGFCAYGENPCGSESDTELQPLSVVFKHSSMSAVAAVRSGSWIVLFIGTSDGQLIKICFIFYFSLLMLDEKFTPGCPTVLFRSDDKRAVLPRMHFDPVDFKYIYIALRKRDVWFHSHPYDRSGLFRLLLNVQNSAVDCVDYFSYKSDPEFTEFITSKVANDLQVNIQKKADMLNLSMSEVTVTGLQGDRQYLCVLEKIESNAVICKIKGAFPAVDSLTITVGNYVLGMSGTKYLFCLSPQDITGRE